MTSLRAFKYSAVTDNTIGSLKSSYLYFPTPEQLNDPFDCQVDIYSALLAAIEKCEGNGRTKLETIAQAKSTFDQVQNDARDFGVCSLTMTATNSVAWSHYAAEHRGICLFYEIPDDFILNADNMIFGRAPVVYGNEPLTDWICENAERIDFKDPKNFVIDVMKKLLTVKASDWAYEVEYRILRMSAGPLDIPHDFLKQVCFGLRCDNASEEAVRYALAKRNSQPIFARITKANSNFELGVLEI